MTTADGRPTTSMPAVSVVIPAYNTAAYIAEALDSVFAQTYKDFEVIVINDGSPDTEALEKALQPYLDRIVYIRQENHGPSAARNAGIRCAQGEFVAFLDSDDAWFPCYLCEQLKFLSNSPKATMVYSDAMLFGESPLSGKSFFETFPPKSPANFENLLNRGSIMTQCVIVRKKVLFEAGLFDEEFFLLEDIHLWLRIAHLSGEILCNKQVLARRRYRPRSQSHVTATEMAEAQIKYMKKLGRTLELTANDRVALEREARQTETELATEQAKLFLSKGEFHQAINSLQIANINCPSAKLRLTIYGLRVAPLFTRFITRVWQWYLNFAVDAQTVRPR